MLELEISSSRLPWRRKVIISLPSTWAELTPTQLLKVLLYHSEKVDDKELFELLTGLDSNILKHVNQWQRYCILKRLSYIQNPEIALNYDLILRGVDNVYPYAFRWITLIKRIYGVTGWYDILSVLYPTANQLKDVSFIKHVIAFNIAGKAYFKKMEQGSIHKDLFLEPEKHPFPDIKVINHKSTMLQDGTFIDPLDN
jgi:hypothetical protein